MGANDKWANKTRSLLAKENVQMLNLIGSPGAGKTALLEQAVKKLSRKLAFAVLEGDIETQNDAERLARLGCEVSQLLTGGGCHLEAKMVHYALRDLPLRRLLKMSATWSARPSLTSANTPKWLCSALPKAKISR